MRCKFCCTGQLKKFRNLTAEEIVEQVEFAVNEKEIEMINNSQADWLHLDIMDGLFVPNISFGFPVLEAVSKLLRKPMDVHYMTVHPEDYIARTARLGAMMMKYVHAVKDRFRQFQRPLRGISAIHFGYR